MTVTMPEEKNADTMQLVSSWSPKSHANIHELLVILGKLFYLGNAALKLDML